MVSESAPARRFARRMVARDPSEHHRPSTTLELLFDLCFVVAISQAAAGLHHAIAHGHWSQGLLSFGMVFFAIWWAWMNFTWFASSFDTDDVPYRLKVLIQMTGVLVIAAGVPRVFECNDLSVMLLGYVIMRIALVAQWVRAAWSVPEMRCTALRYAVGIFVVQALWVARQFWFPSTGVWSFLLLAFAEMAVPAWAERTRPTTWHPGHIVERYGLLTIIVIGESVLAAVIAVQAALAAGHPSVLNWCVIASTPVILFAMWWLYFLIPGERVLKNASLNQAIAWGYGHFVFFSSAAAVGAGLALSVDFASHEAHISTSVAGLSLGIPCAIFLLAIRTLILQRGLAKGPTKRAFEVAVPLVLVASLQPLYPVWIALILAATVAVGAACESEPQSGAF